MTIELVLLFTVLVVALLIVVGLGRIALGTLHTEQAAAAAARAASLTTTPAQARTSSQRVATETLRSAGITCRRVTIDVDTTSFHPGGVVSVSVACTADLSGLAMTGLPGTVTVHATSSSVLETHRDLTGGGQ
jgi:Flp pilus assembly protein TadG